MVWLVVILLALGGPAEAQKQRKKKQPAPAKVETAPSVWPVESLEVRGNQTYTRDQVLALAGLKTGQPAGKELFEAARDRLLATGLFENVGYRYQPSPGGKGYAATIELVEVLPVYPVRFEDLPAPDADLLGALRAGTPLFTGRIPATKEMLDRCTRVLEAYLATRGFRDKLIARVRSDAPERFFVLFRPAAMPPSIAYVKFLNSQVLPASTLQNAMAGLAVGVVYNEERFRQLLDTGIRPLYDARGRLRVAFPSIETAPAPDVKGLLVTVRVEEGPSFNLGAVKIEGGPFQESELLKAGAFPTGKLADFDAIEAGRQRIHRLLRRNGFMKVQSSFERAIDDKALKVDLRLQIVPGPRFTFGRLILVGLDIQTEPVVRRLWAMKPGKPFDADYPDYFLARIREDGIFDNLGKTRSQIQVNDAGQTVDVTLYFR